MALVGRGRSFSWRKLALLAQTRGLSASMVDPAAGAHFSPSELEQLSSAVKRTKGLFVPARETRALALLVGWASSSKKALSKYAPLYTELGVACVCVTPSVLHVWSTTRGNSLTEEILNALDSSLAADGPPRPLVLHIFSGGGSACLPRLTEVFAKTHSLRSKLFPVGAVFDSGPTDFTYDAGVAAGKLAYTQGGYNVVSYCTATAIGITAEKLIGTRKRLELRQALASPLLQLPQLYLYSKSDPVTRPEWVEEVVAGQRERRRNVRMRCWVDSTHVRHFTQHPEEYRTEIQNFLYLCKVVK